MEKIVETSHSGRTQCLRKIALCMAHYPVMLYFLMISLCLKTLGNYMKYFVESSSNDRTHGVVELCARLSPLPCIGLDCFPLLNFLQMKITKPLHGGLR